MATEDNIRRIKNSLDKRNTRGRSRYRKTSSRNRKIANNTKRYVTNNNNDDKNKSPEDFLKEYNNMINSRSKNEYAEMQLAEYYEDRKNEEIKAAKQARIKEERQANIQAEHDRRVEKQRKKRERRMKIKGFVRDFIKSLKKPFMKIAAIGVSVATLLPAAATVSKEHKNINNEEKPVTEISDTNREMETKTQNSDIEQAYNEIKNDNKGKVSDLTEQTNKKQLVGRIELQIKEYLSNKRVKNVNNFYISNGLYFATIAQVNANDGTLNEHPVSVGGFLTVEQKRALDYINEINSGNEDHLDELYHLKDVIEEQMSENNKTNENIVQNHDIDR